MTLKRAILSVTVLLSTMVILAACEEPVCAVTTYWYDPVDGERFMYCVEWQ